MPSGIYQHKQLSEKTKRRISEANKGRIAWNKGKPPWNKGKTLTEEHR